MVLLHATQATVPPPARFPDLYPRLVSAWSCLQLCLAYGYVTVRTFVVPDSWVLDKVKRE